MTPAKTTKTSTATSCVSNDDEKIRQRKRRVLLRRVAKACLPVLCLLILSITLSKYYKYLFPAALEESSSYTKIRSALVRVLITLIMIVVTEYTTRWVHRDVFHGKLLWWMHSTHHHLLGVRFGDVPRREANKMYPSPDKMGAVNKGGTLICDERQFYTESCSTSPGEKGVTSDKASSKSSSPLTRAMPVSPLSPMASPHDSPLCGKVKASVGSVRIRKDRKNRNKAAYDMSGLKATADTTRYGSSFVELNDLYPVVNGFLSFVLLLMGCWGRPITLARDCWTGIALGNTLYGMSYFVGHDLVAHRRAGSGLARLLGNLSPYMLKCCEVHSRYHHTVKMNQEEDDDSDPHGPPFGFWLGPEEVEHYERWKKEKRKEWRRKRRNTRLSDDELSEEDERGMVGEKGYQPPPVPTWVLWCGYAVASVTAASTLSHVLYSF